MKNGDRREPAVAGSFYPADPGPLRALVEELLAGVPDERRRARAAIVPHAGLQYSGACAAQVWGRLAIPGIVVIVAPNHTGLCRSPGASLWAHGAFETPLGAVAVDEAFAEAVARSSVLAAHDPLAHAQEHAIEVELPFLRVRAPTAAIAPVVLAWDDWDSCRSFAGALVAAVRATAHEVLLVASSDMTHYESAESAAAKDRHALTAVKRLDGRGLLDACVRHRVTMCGRAPAAVVLEAARQLGASRAEVVDYRHSGMVTGDDESVVAYAGVIVS